MSEVERISSARLVEEWVKGKGAVLHGVSAQHTENAGLGVVATEPLKTGLTVATLPAGLSVTTITARQSPFLRPLLHSAEFSPIQTLCLFLLSEVALGVDSKWLPWLHSLPPAFETLLHLTPHELQFLRLDRYIAKVEMEQQRAKTMWTDLVDKLANFLTALPIEDAVSNSPSHTDTISNGSNGSKGSSPSPPASTFVLAKVLEDCTFDRFLWSYCCLMSRGFWYPVNPSEGDVWCMMPWADFLNYEEGAEDACAAVDPLTGKFNVRTTRPVPQGKEIFITYGSYSNFELQLWYGFAVPHSINTRLTLSSFQGPDGEDDCSEVIWVHDRFNRLLEQFRSTSADAAPPKWSEECASAFCYADEWTDRIAMIGEKGWHYDWRLGRDYISNSLISALLLLTTTDPRMCQLQTNHRALKHISANGLLLLKALCAHTLDTLPPAPVDTPNTPGAKVAAALCEDVIVLCTHYASAPISTVRTTTILLVI
eukprot:NODE_503_length_1597_cov_238.388243_g382_i0.p1 GENE.NODE_503_length_1597_cov_238.388243_g382_i0~~NODE_503_length_1597_cov_238.388243_g382_i0.p1  ORF type:complete len:511 (+),score=126.46 NODE_503_length_1597_cov_238.388243_g382_i0:87-1535(+)